MQPRTPALFFLSFCCVLTACKSKPETQERSAVPNAVSAETVISFTDRTDRTPPFSEKEFQRLAGAIMKKSMPSDVTLRSAALQGILEDDGEHCILTLNVRLAPADQDLSLRTGLKAVSASAESTKTLIHNGLSDLKRAVSDLLRLVHAPPAGLVEALSAAEPDIQIAAAAVIGARKIPSATVPLCALLGDPREEVADAAAEALKQVAEPPDISRIIASIERNNLRSQVRALEVIGRIGGEEAEAYLEMTALGHPVEEVRALSSSLLKMLKKKPRLTGEN